MSCAQLLANVEKGAELTFSVIYEGSLPGREFFATVKQFTTDETPLASLTEGDGLTVAYDEYTDKTTIAVSIYSTLTELFPLGPVFFGLWAVDPNDARTDVDVVSGSLNVQAVAK